MSDSFREIPSISPGRTSGLRMTARTMRSGPSSVALLLIFFSLTIPALRAQTTAKQLESHALALEKDGNAQGALAAWEKAAALDPKSAVIQDHIGFLFAVLNRRDEAIPHFLHALELDQHFAPAHFHLGVAYVMQRDPNLGIPELQAAVDAVPNNFDHRFYLGRALNDTAHYREALVQLRAATALNATNAEAWNQLGLALQNTGSDAVAV